MFPLFVIKELKVKHVFRNFTLSFHVVPFKKDIDKMEYVLWIASRWLGAGRNG